MKLLLTSGGLTNETLRNVFLDLVHKQPEDIKVAFINTASKVEKDKSFVDRDILNLKKTGVSNITFADISEQKEKWESTLLNSDVILVEGGNTFYLLDELRKSGLNKNLKDIVKDKLYLGVSAGSIVITPTVAIAGIEPGDPNNIGMTDFTGLDWVTFEVSPHTPSFVPLRNVEQYAKESGRKLYAYDDKTAVLVLDGKASIVGEGFSKEFN